MERVVDVAIIGAGSAGLFALSKVRRATDSWVLIDGGELGTTCARVGCMPSKVLIQVAEDFHRRHIFDRCGIEGGDALHPDLAEVMEYVRDLRDTFVDQVLSHSTDEMDETQFIAGHARFLEPTLLEVDGQQIRAGRVVVATGSRPLVPEAWQAFGDRILTTDNLFERETLPGRIAVIGLGAIGIELGQALARLGVEVTGVELADTIAGIRDPEINKLAIQTIGRDFPLWLGHAAEVEQTGGALRVRAGEREVEVDALLVCIGRIPNVDDLGLENLPVARDDRGVPAFDPHTMQVGDLPVFIAGDCTGTQAILHEAGAEGRIAGFNAVQDEPVAFQRHPPLAITFADPNIAVIGQDWDSLDQERIAIGEVRMAPVGRALIKGRNRGLIRLYADKGSGGILGATLLAADGEHIAHLLALAIQHRMTVFDLLRMPFYHPTMEEALQAALHDLVRKVDADMPPMLELARRD